MDFYTAKKITIPEGNVKSIIEKNGGTLLWKAGYQNLVPTSIDSDGSILDACGYRNGCRVRSSGALAAMEHSAATGYIAVKAGDVLRFKGGDWAVASVENCIHYSAEGFVSLGSITAQPAYYGICTEENSKLTEAGGLYTHTVPDHSDIRYVRISLHGSGTHGADLIVTVNEEIDE